jgi:hypothetical protein
LLLSTLLCDSAHIFDKIQDRDLKAKRIETGRACSSIIEFRYGIPQPYGMALNLHR